MEKKKKEKKKIILTQVILLLQQFCVHFIVHRRTTGYGQKVLMYQYSGFKNITKMSLLRPICPFAAFLYITHVILQE